MVSLSVLDHGCTDRQGCEGCLCEPCENVFSTHTMSSECRCAFTSNQSTWPRPRSTRSWRSTSGLWLLMLRARRCTRRCSPFRASAPLRGESECRWLPTALVPRAFPALLRCAWQKCTVHFSHRPKVYRTPAVVCKFDCYNGTVPRRRVGVTLNFRI